MKAELAGPKCHLSLPQRTAACERRTEPLIQLTIRPAIWLGEPRGEPRRTDQLSQPDSVQSGASACSAAGDAVVRNFSRRRHGSVVEWIEVGFAIDDVPRSEERRVGKECR